MMLKRLIGIAVATAFALLAQASPAAAQGCGQSNPNCIVPTAPNGTSNNQAASTAFVQNAFAGGSSLALASGKIFIGSAGNIATPQTFSGDGTLSIAGVFTLASVNPTNVGSWGSATQCPTFTVNAKGLITAAGQTTCTPAIGSITGLGTGVVTALGIALNGSGGLLGPTPTRAGDVPYWNGSAWITLAGNNSGTNCFSESSSGVPSWATCGGAGAVSSVSNSDGTLTISPTTGAVVASIALSHANTWSGQQTFVAPALGTPASATLTNATGLPTTGLTGTLQAAQEPAHTGDMTNTAGSLATTVTKTNGVSFGPLATVTPGTGVAAALGIAANGTGGFPTYAASTWSCALAGSSTPGTFSGQNYVCSYEQIGRQVIVRFVMTATGASPAPTGNLTITGLPVANNSTTNDAGICSLINWTGWTGDTGFTTLTATISGSGSTTILFTENGSGKVAQATPVSDYVFTAANFQGSCVYHS